MACQLEALRRCLTARSIKQVLETLPVTLDDTYEQILLGIIDDHGQKALSALTWLTISERPLALAELADACVIDNSKDPAFDPEERLLDPKSILTILSSLVSSQEDNDTEIRLAHFSVKEYLTSDRISRGPASRFRFRANEGHDLILRSCLHYIQCIPTHDDILRADSISTILRSQAPLPQEPAPRTSDQHTAEPHSLLKYASKYWPAHARYLGENLVPATKKLVVDFLLSRNSVRKWITSSIPDDVSMYSEEQHVPALYLAASQRLNGILEDISTTGIDVNEQSIVAKYNTALQAACVTGDNDIVSKLLARNADVNIQGGKYGNALQAAAYGGHAYIVAQLLAAGAMVDAYGGAHHTALEAVASSPKRNPEVLNLLLSYGACVERDEKGGGLLLKWAAILGYDTVVEALLKNISYTLDNDDYEWTSARIRDEAGRSSYTMITKVTAPYEAALNGREEVMKLFLRHMEQY